MGGVPAGPPRAGGAGCTMGEAIADPQIASRGVIHRHQNANGIEGGFGVPLAAFTFAHGGRASTPAPPQLGQHNDEILRELGSPMTSRARGGVLSGGFFGFSSSRAGVSGISPARWPASVSRPVSSQSPLAARRARSPAVGPVAPGCSRATATARRAGRGRAPPQRARAVLVARRQRGRRHRILAGGVDQRQAGVRRLRPVLGARRRGAAPGARPRSGWCGRRATTAPRPCSWDRCPR